MYVDDIRTMYLSMGMSWISLVSDEGIAQGISNSVGLHFIYFGGVCGLLAFGFLIMLCRLRRFSLWLLLLVQLGILWCMQGGYNTAMLWCTSAAIVAAAKRRVAPAVKWEAADARVEQREFVNGAVDVRQ